MSRIHEALRRLELEKRSSTTEEQIDHSDLLTDLSSLLASSEIVTQPTLGAKGANAISGTPNLLSVCRRAEWDPNPKRAVFADPQDSFHPGLEEFRTLRTRIQRMSKGSLKTILVVSALPQEGKTFVCANLAHAMCGQGKRVLIVDADLRRPAQHRFWGTCSRSGLSEYLAGDLEVRDILQKGPFDGLYLIPSGQQCSNPAELLSSGKLHRLVEQLREVFDAIIIDTSPTAVVSDAVAIADVADGILFVVRAEKTRVKHVTNMRHEFGNHRILGVVLNYAAHQGVAPSYEYGPLAVESSSDSRDVLDRGAAAKS